MTRCVCSRFIKINSIGVAIMCLYCTSNKNILYTRRLVVYRNQGDGGVKSKGTRLLIEKEK